MNVERPAGEVAAMRALDLALLEAAVAAHARRAPVRVIVPVPPELLEELEEIERHRERAAVGEHIDPLDLLEAAELPQMDRDAVAHGESQGFP